MSALTQSTLLGAKVVVSKAAVAKRTNVVTRAGQYDDELLQTAVSFFSFFFTLMCVCSFAAKINRVNLPSLRRGERFAAKSLCADLNAFESVLCDCVVVLDGFRS